MIRTLTIHNIALIEDISVEFHNGMTVLSGETGAGKSIIIDAVTLLLGGRADRDLIRTGCDHASVEAEFWAESPENINKVMEREQIEWNGHNIIVFRDISQTGRNICRINGIVVPVSVLKEITTHLLNLHGQSEHQVLADEEIHLAFLDLMGDAEHRILIEKTMESYHKFIINHREYAKLVKMNENRERRIDTLRLELDELHRAGIQPGEEERLANESKRLHKASRIREKIDLAYRLISNGDESSDVMHQLKTAVGILNSLGDEDPGFLKVAERCENLYYELEEAAYELENLSNRYDFDANALERAENRLESIRKVSKKYGPSEKDIIRNQEQIEKEYRTLIDLDEQLLKTGNEHKKLLSIYRSNARELSARRRKLADEFRDKMMKELKDLGMEHTLIEATFKDHPSDKPVIPSRTGDDQIVFMISPNPGEPMKPMSKIASGGELSRIMLALKTIESGKGGMQTMVFDEIDTGISGRMAQAVAEKMNKISRRQQVICISHLPQIAAAADHHILVHKEIHEGRTLTEVTELSGDERKNEIARMISGAEGITSDAKQYAGQMIDAAKRKREKSEPE